MDNLKNRQLELTEWGLPEGVLNYYHKKGITKMFQWQADCLSLGSVLDGENVIYSAPTSAGKTLVAEILVSQTVFEKQKKALIILPFVSVVREKMFYFQEMYSECGIRVEGFMGGHTPTASFQQVSVGVSTIEKANSLINKMLEEKTLSNLGIVVVDELHLLGDSYRGYLLELLLTKLKYMSSVQDDIKLQIVGMSATLPNLNVLSKWLNAKLYFTEFRPVPLQERLKCGSAILNNKLEKVDELVVAESDAGDDSENVGQLCIQTIKNGHSVLIFCSSKAWCENLSAKLAAYFRKLGCSKDALNEGTSGWFLRKQLDLGKLNEVVEHLKISPVGLDKDLAKTVPFGVAFHHAGLTLDERDIIEGSFRNGSLRVLCATSTLSSGVNLPARRVIIRSPMSFGGVMDIMTYKQMIGRAGRMGVDTEGESILICKPTEKNVCQQLISSGLKPITSCLGSGRLSASLKRAILEVVASGIATTAEQVAQYAASTFLAVSSKDALNDPLSSCISFLEEHELIRLKEGGYAPTPLGEACLASSLPPDEGLALFRELERARRCFVLDSDLHIIYQITPYSVSEQWTKIDWLRVLNMIEELTPSMRRVAELVGVEDAFLVKVVKNSINLSNQEHRSKLSIHRRFYTALALQDLVNEIPLTEVALKYDCNKGTLQSLQQSAATYAGMVAEFSRRLRWGTVELIVSQFQERLQFGVQRELCELMKLPSLNGIRARALFNAGITSLPEVANCDIAELEKALMGATPFQSRGQGAGEPVHEAQQRTKMQAVWVTGRAGLNIREAAEIIMKEAREILELELGVSAKWGAAEQSVVRSQATPARARISIIPQPSTSVNKSAPANSSQEKPEDKSPLKIQVEPVMKMAECQKSPVKNQAQHMKIDGCIKSPLKIQADGVMEVPECNKLPLKILDQGMAVPVCSRSPLKIQVQDIKVPECMKSPIKVKISGLKVSPLKIQHQGGLLAAIGKPINPQVVIVDSDVKNTEESPLAPAEEPRNRLSIIEKDSIIDGTLFGDKAIETINDENAVQKSEVSGLEDLICCSDWETTFKPKPSTSKPVACVKPSRKSFDPFEGSLNIDLLPTFSAKLPDKLAIRNRRSLDVFECSPKPCSTPIAACRSSQSVDSPDIFSQSLTFDTQLERVCDSEEQCHEDIPSSPLKSDDLGYLTDSPPLIVAEISAIKPALLDTVGESFFIKSSGVKRKASPDTITGSDDSVSEEVGRKERTRNRQQARTKLFTSRIKKARKDVPVVSLDESDDDEIGATQQEEKMISVGTTKMSALSLCRKRSFDQSKTTPTKPKQQREFASPGAVTKDIGTAALSLSRKRSFDHSKSTPTKPKQLREFSSPGGLPEPKDKDNEGNGVIAREEVDDSIFLNSKWNTLDIVDVCGHPDVFSSFREELKEQTIIGLALGCRKKVAPPKSRIGANFKKSEEIKKCETNDAENQFYNCDIVLDGVAVYWQENTVFYIKSDSLGVSKEEKLQVFEELSKKTKRIFETRDQIRVLNQCSGVLLDGIFEDPKVAAWLMTETGNEEGLKSMVKQIWPDGSAFVDLVLRNHSADSVALKTDSAVPPQTRACCEAFLSYHLMRKQLPLLRNLGMLTVFEEAEMPTVQALADMELNGFMFDESKLKLIKAELSKHISGLESKAFSLAGRRFALSSYGQVYKVLFTELRLGKKLPQAKKSTSKETLELLEAETKHPLPRVILQWRKIQAILNKTLCPLLQQLPKTRVHGICQTLTVTGRISMREPNMQNIPRDFQVALDNNTSVEVRLRDMFVAPEGYTILSADYCQIELRLLAHLAADTALIESITSTSDVFRSIAASIHGIEEENVTDEQRQVAKQTCYGIIYGIGAKSLSQQLKLEENVARTLMDDFMRKYSGVKNYLQSTISDCREKGYVETLGGRRRYLQAINSNVPAARSEAERQAVNTRVQGSAADLVKIAMVAIREKAKQLQNADLKLVLHLHDELIYEVRKEAVNDAGNLIKDCMESAKRLSVPFTVKVRSGPSWGQLWPLQLPS